MVSPLRTNERGNIDQFSLVRMRERSGHEESSEQGQNHYANKLHIASLVFFDEVVASVGLSRCRVCALMGLHVEASGT